MAASAKITVKHYSPDNKNNTEIFNCDPTKINVNMSSDTAVAVRTWALGFVSLSADTYQDVEITQTNSVNSIIAE